MELFLKIALPTPLKRLFTYKYESDFDENLIGRRALVQFNKRIITGYVIEQSIENSEKHEIDGFKII